MRHWLMRLSRDDSAATAVEYAFIVSLIAAVVVAGVVLVGRSTTNNFSAVTSLWP